MNPVQYFVKMGFRITSDPNTYSSGVWGLRNYTLNGFNYDSFCNGYHRAYDFAKSHLAAIPSVCDGTVVSGTTGWGNFGGQVCILDDNGQFQHIYGHLDRNIPVKVGQKVKQGQTIGRQSNTNYYNTYMASHLHYQVQEAGWRPEWQFVCSGIDPLKVDVSGGGKAPAPSEVLMYDDAWDWKGKVKTTANINYRIYPHTDAPKEDTIPKGTVLSFDRLYKSDKLWWIRTKYDGGIWFVALGELKQGAKFLKALDAGKLWADPVGKVDTSGGKFDGKKNGYSIADANETDMVVAQKLVDQPTYNPNKNRGRSLEAYVMGTIDSLGAEVRKRRGSKASGFNWNQKAGYELPAGSTVYIFEQHDGWGRIYTGRQSGQGSNDWIWLGRMTPQKIFK